MGMATKPFDIKQNPVTTMITTIKRIVLSFFAAALLAIAGTGCNTAHGFGKDMEKAGDKIQEGTD